MTRVSRWLVALATILVLALPVRVATQGGPFSAEIENFWRVISTGGRTFTNISVSGGSITVSTLSLSGAATLAVGTTTTSRVNLAGTNAGISYDGTFLNFNAGDGGAYGREAVGQWIVNSADFELTNGGTPKFVFPAVGATDGQVQFTNGSKANGVGIDVLTDGLMKVRTRAFSADAQLSAEFVSVGTGMTVANVGANSCGTTAAAIAGNQNAFVVTVGATSGTQCRVAFPFAAANEWDCGVAQETTGLAIGVSPVDTTHTDFLASFSAGAKFIGVCWPR